MVSHAIDRGILTVTAEGQHTFEDVGAAIRAALSDPRIPAEVPLLMDVCESDHVPRPEDIIAFADFLKTTQGLVSRRVAVLACDALRYGLGRELSGWSASRGIQVRVFELGEREAARAWLLSVAPVAENAGR